MKKLFAILACFLLFVSCSKKSDQKETQVAELSNLPKLAPVKVPKGVTGTYVGELPCDECDHRSVEMTLDSTGSLVIKETLDKSAPIISKATYKDSSSYVIVRFNDGKRFWTFKNNKGTSLIYLNIDGKPYMDDTEEPYQLFRILNVPSTKE